MLTYAFLYATLFLLLNLITNRIIRILKIEILLLASNIAFYYCRMMLKKARKFRA